MLDNLKSAGAPDHVLASAALDPTKFWQLYQLLKDHVGDIQAVWTLALAAFHIFYPTSQPPVVVLPTEVK